MRYLIILIIALSTFSLFSQNEECKGLKHLDENKFHDMYVKYISNGKKRVIEKYRKEYFSGNIFEELAPDKKVHPLFFDSYGSLYPDVLIFKYLKDKNYKCLSHRKYYLDDYSLFFLFRCHKNFKPLSKAINELEDKKKKDFYSDLLLKTSCSQKGQGCKDGTISIQSKKEEFYAKWDAFQNNQAHRFKEKIQGYDRVLFYVPGFNNPYSFCAMQALEVLEKSESLIDKPEKILLVPILWRTMAHKKPKKKKGKFEDKNYNTPRVFQNFWFHFNSAYLAGLGLRRILNEVETEPEKIPKMCFYAHSSGTTLIAATFINPVKKLEDTDEMQEYLTNNSCEGKLPIVEIKNKSLYCNSVNYWTNCEIISRFQNNPIPKKGNYHVLMSAASMPGKATFDEMCEMPKNKLVIFSVINPCDKDLRKKILKNPYAFSDTTLGLDYEGDAQVSKRLCEDKNVVFKLSEPLEGQTKHSVLNYINNPNFLSFFKDWLEYEIEE